MFPKVFRSITVDNGVEFADYEGLERSVLHEGEKRTFLSIVIHIAVGKEEQTRIVTALFVATSQRGRISRKSRIRTLSI